MARGQWTDVIGPGGMVRSGGRRNRRRDRPVMPNALGEAIQNAISNPMRSVHQPVRDNGPVSFHNRATPGGGGGAAIKPGVPDRASAGGGGGAAVKPGGQVPSIAPLEAMLEKAMLQRADPTRSNPNPTKLAGKILATQRKLKMNDRLGSERFGQSYREKRVPGGEWHIYGNGERVFVNKRRNALQDSISRALRR